MKSNEKKKIERRSVRLSSVDDYTRRPYWVDLSEKEKAVCWDAKLRRLVGEVVSYE